VDRNVCKGDPVENPRPDAQGSKKSLPFVPRIMTKSLLSYHGQYLISFVPRIVERFKAGLLILIEGFEVSNMWIGISS